MTQQAVLPVCTRAPGVSRARWAELYLWIRTDHTPPRLMPFRRTKSQRILRQRTAEVVRRARAENQGAHIFLVKPRRFKATSEWLAEIFSACATERLTEALILAQTRPDSEKILRAMHLFYDKLPATERPSRRAENKQEFDFNELGSYIGTGTANAISSGRGGGLQFGLNDEAAWSQLGFDDAEQLFVALSEACRYGLFVNQSTPRPTGWFRDKVEALAAGRDNSAYLITTTHWEDDENRLPVTPQEIAEIYATLTDEEKTRAALAGFDTTQPLNGSTEVWERLKWRRRKWAKLGRLAPQEYIEDLSSCWVARGEYFYDPDALAKQMLAAKDAEPIFEQQVSEDSTGDGIVRLWEEYDPHSRYVVITDSSTGTPTGDPGLSVLWNLRTMRQAGEVHCRVRPKILARLTYEHLCKKYGLPLWVPERNHPGPAIIDAALYDIQYPNLYRAVNRDKASNAKWEDKWGWVTSPYSRVAMLESSREAIAEGSITVLSDRIIGDCSRFKLKQVDATRYRYEAEGGAHDEGPIVLGILTQVILEGSTTVPTVDFIDAEEDSPWIS